MSDIEIKLTLSANVSEVYSLVTDYEADEQLRGWQSDVKTVGVTAGKPMRTGSMVALTKSFLGSDVFMNFDVIDMQRNKRFEVKGVHGRFPFTRAIEMTPNGRETIVTDRITVNSGTFWFWWKPFVVRGLRAQTESQWQALKNLLEK
ncbi:MAG: hypothetical protein AAFR81_16880 [Chloroflexota bacterium]